jgi:endonuclease/exonuclease/phosphatase family metal-dependent hydrolase
MFGSASWRTDSGRILRPYMRSALVLSSSILLFSSACTAPKRVSAQNTHSVASTSNAAGPALRVMTFNVQSCRHGLDRVAAVIRAAAPDVVALQEVDRGTRRANGLDQGRELARRTGLEHSAHFATTRMAGGEYGVGLVSRFPILSTRFYTLPTPRHLEPRGVAHAVLDVDGHEVSVYVTHLTNLPRRSELRFDQARFIARVIQEDPRPVLLMGDLNDAPDSPALLLLKQQLADAFAHRGRGPAETYPLPFVLPDLRLDYVLSSPDLTARDVFVLREIASDHYPVIADFSMPRPSVARSVLDSSQ